MFCIPFSSLSDQELIAKASERIIKHKTDWETEIWRFLQNWLQPEISSVTLYTSGSTGEPKEILHSKGAMLNSARMTCDALHLKPHQKALLCLPANKISGMMMIVRSIWSKMDLYCIRPSITPLHDISESERFDLAAFTPMQLFEINSDSKRRHQAERIHTIIIGGDEIPPLLLKTLYSMKNRAFATFGMTETISHIALKRLNGTHPDNAFRILPGIKISQDDRKCLVVEAPELGVRHLQTNDVVHIQSATEFEWLGRKDNVINSGGLKIFPEQIEAKLKPILDIPFFITAVPNSQSGQQVAIAIEKEKLTLQEANALKSRFHTLGKLQSPKAILAIPVFERTDNGKIKRKESLRKIAMKIAL